VKNLQIQMKTLTPGLIPKPKDLPVPGAVEEAEVAVLAFHHRRKEGKLNERLNFHSLKCIHRPQASQMQIIPKIKIPDKNLKMKKWLKAWKR